MFTVQINNHSFSVPEIPSEVLLTNYIPFQRMYNEFCNMVTNEEVDITIQKKMIIKMSEAIQGYFSEDVDFDDIAGIPVGYYRESIMSLGRSEINKIDKSLSMIFNQIVNVISSYKPKNVDKDYSFTYKGKRFVISTIHRPTYKGSLTVSEAIEILEAQRIAYQSKDKKGVDNVKFSELLTMIAILAREQGETFPIEQTEIDDMISHRTVFFSEITMDVAIDIAFFFDQFWRNLRNDPNCTFYFNPVQKKSKTKEESEAYAKAKAENDAMFKRVGYRYMYPKIIESGTFGTKLSEVMEASMRSAVRYLSILHGM